MRPALLAAALLAAGWLFAEGRGAGELVAFRLSPSDAAVYESGRELPILPGANGARVARVVRGLHEFVIVAEGCVAARASLDVAPGRTELQVKLERAGSLLRYGGEGATGARPKSAALTPDGRLLVLPLLSGSGADLLDAATLAAVGRLEPPAPYAKAEGFVETAVFPGAGELWVSQMHNSTIHAFDLGTLAYKDSFPSGGSYPKVIAASSDGKRAYVTNWLSEDLTILDLATRAVQAKVKLGGIPRGLAASSDGRYLYAALFAGPGGRAEGGGSILRLRLADLALDALWPPDGGAKRHLVLDEARGRLYATDMGRDSLFAIETATGRLVREIHLGPNPNTCALSPDGRTIYACTRGPNGERGYEREGPEAGELVAIDAESLETIARQWGGDQPTGLAVSPDGRRVYFTDFLDRRVETYFIDDAFDPRGRGDAKGRAR